MENKEKTDGRRRMSQLEMAELFVRERLRGVGGERTLWSRAGRLWRWYGGRWKGWADDQLTLEIMDWAKQKTQTVRYKDGREVEVPMCVGDRREVEDLAWLVGRMCQFPYERMPVWVKRPVGWEGNDRLSVGFDDVVVGVEADGVKTVKRTPDWVDPCVLPCEWDPNAKCPVWEKASLEWGEGDPAWVEMLERAIGMSLVSERRWARWVLLQGKTRGGKGTIMRVLEYLLGEHGCVGTTLEGLTGEYGLVAMVGARAITVGEVGGMPKSVAARAAVVLKSMVGGDKIEVNRKYGDVGHVPLPVVPWLSSNPIVNLPDHGGALMGKMLVLPFRVSFLGREDMEMEEKLRGEVAGIARRAVEALQRLVGAKKGEEWPRPEEGKRALRVHQRAGNPLDTFLEGRFDKNPDGFVATKLLKREMAEYQKTNRVSLGVHPNWLVAKLEQESGWDLRAHRNWQGERGLKGLSLKAEYLKNDDVGSD